MKNYKVKNALISILLIGACLFSAISFAANKTPLPADQAFVFSTVMDRPNAVLMQWIIAPHYYLYAKRLHIDAKTKSAIEVDYPQGEFKYDAERGRFEAFAGTLSIPVLIKSTKDKLQLKVRYQGCSEDGFCYPPMQKNIVLNLKNLTVSNQETHNENVSSLLTDQNNVQSLLHTYPLGVLFFLFIALGLLLAFTPCVLPMIPILTSIIVGQKETLTTKSAFFLSLTYVIGMSLTYAIAGMVVASLGSSLQIWLQKPAIIISTSILFVLLAASLFGFYDLRLPRRFHNHVSKMSNQLEGGTYIGVFIMGVLSTLIVSPCVTAPLVGVLMYIAQTGNLLFGATTLFAMGVGMGIPLILIGVSAGKWLPKTGPWMEAVKNVFGLLMLGMAVWLLSRIVSEMMLFVLLGLLLICIAIYIGIYLPQLIPPRKLHRGVGLVVGLSGMLLMLGGVSMPEVINKWVNTNTFSAQRSFIVVPDVAALHKQLLIAQAAHQPVLLDYYADWCVSCVTMDRHVFKLPAVQQGLKNYVLLRADLSGNTENDIALLKNYNVIAPPTVLFFDPVGHEMNSDRIVGEVSANEFLARLNIIGSRF